MVCINNVSLSIRPLYPCFPRKWYTSELFPTQISHFIHASLVNGTPQNCFPLKSATLSMLRLQMVRLKIVSHSNRLLYPCFPHKWYTSKLFPTQIGHFVSLANGAPQNCFPLKSATLSMFHSQMVLLKVTSHSNRPLYLFFPRKWYASKFFPTEIDHFIPCSLKKWYTLKLFPNQIGHFIHGSLANVTPQNCFPLKSATWSMFPSQMVHLKILSYSNQPLYPCFPC